MSLLVRCTQHASARCYVHICGCAEPLTRYVETVCAYPFTCSCDDVSDCNDMGDATELVQGYCPAKICQAGECTAVTLPTTTPAYCACSTGWMIPSMKDTSKGCKYKLQQSAFSYTCPQPTLWCM